MEKNIPTPSNENLTDKQKWIIATEEIFAKAFGGVRRTYKKAGKSFVIPVSQRPAEEKKKEDEGK